MHPNPSFVVVVGRRFLVQLKLFDNSLCVEVLQVFEIFRLGLILLDILDVGNKIVGFYLLVRILIVFSLVVQSLHLLCFFLKGHFLQKPFDFIIVILSEVGFIAFHFNIQLLNSLLFGLLCSRFDVFGGINLNVVRFFNVLALLDFVIHFFQLFLQLLLFIFFSVFFRLFRVDYFWSC